MSTPIQFRFTNISNQAVDISTAPATIYSYSITNQNNYPILIKLYNKSAANFNIGDTQQQTITVPANSVLNNPSVSYVFSTSICGRCVTGVLDADTTAPAVLPLVELQFVSGGVDPANTTSTPSQFFTSYNSNTGSFTKAQPAYSDISNIPSVFAPGTTVIYHTDGTSTLYTPSANTDAARGTALSAALAAHAAGEYIAVGAGTFQVSAPLTVLSGVTIEGRGIGVTTIKLADQGSGAFANLLSIINNAVNYALVGTIVRGIKFDCNLAGQSSTTAAVGAVMLAGTYCQIENCRAINWGSKLASAECFIFAILSLPSVGFAGPVFNNKILYCVIDTPAAVVHAQGVTGVMIAGENLTGTGIYTPGDGWQSGPEIAGCVVQDVSTGTGSGNVPYFHAFGFTYTVGGMLHDNYATNLLVGSGGTTDCTAVYSDTGSQIGTQWRNNTFYNVTNGFEFVFGNPNHYLLQYCTIANNFITTAGPSSWGILFWPNVSWPSLNCRINNNYIISNNGGGQPCIGLFNSQVFWIEYNTLDTTHAHPIFDEGGNSTILQKSNHKSDGTIIAADFAPVISVLTEGGTGSSIGSSTSNFSTTLQTPSASTRTYITGSKITVPSSNLRIGTTFHWTFNMTKTAAGVATSTIDVAVGTAGTTADTARLSFTKPIGTAAVDEGMVTIDAVVRGPLSASGIMSGECQITHNGNTVGHMTIPFAVLNTISGTFDVTVANLIVGLCITTGASDAITIQQVTARATNL